MIQELLVLFIVLVAVYFAIRSFYRQFTTSGESGCSSCPDCATPASDSMHSSYFKAKRERKITYKKIDPL
jgi:attachment p12 family protein